MIKQSSRVFRAKPVTCRRTPVVCRANPPQKHEIKGVHVISIACAVAAVSVSLVLITTAREFNLDLEKTNEEYARLQHVSMQLSTLKRKQIEDEIILNALVEEIIKLREIGVV